MNTNKIKMANLPVIVEKDESNFYVAECPLFEGCYTQGKVLKCLFNKSPIKSFKD